MGLFLVIWGHLLYGGTWATVNKAIYSFHMPMYFVLAGYVSHPRKTSYSALLKRKLYELLLPFAIFAAASLPVYFYQFHGQSFSAWSYLETILFWNGQVAFNDPLWFLIIMLFVVLIREAVGLPEFPPEKRLVSAVCSFMAGYALYAGKTALPLGFDKLLVCMGFYELGSVLQCAKPRPGWQTALVMAASAVLWFMSGVIYNGKVSLYTFSLQNYWLFILSGLTGSLVWFGIAHLFQRSRFFTYLGKNTILVVCTQYFGIYPVRAILRECGLEGTWKYDLLSIAITSAALLLYVPVSKFVNLHMPWLVGKRRIYAEACIEQN